MIRETLVKIDGQVIGHLTPGGRYLDRAVFLRLPPTYRLRAYLGLVAPAPRRAGLLARVCRLHGSIANYLKRDVQRGRIMHLPQRQGYALVREAWVEEADLQEDERRA